MLSVIVSEIYVFPVSAAISDCRSLLQSPVDLSSSSPWSEPPAFPGLCPLERNTVRAKTLTPILNPTPDGFRFSRSTSLSHWNFDDFYHRPTFADTRISGLVSIWPVPVVVRRRSHLATLSLSSQIRRLKETNLSFFFKLNVWGLLPPSSTCA